MRRLRNPVKSVTLEAKRKTGPSTLGRDDRINVLRRIKAGS